MSHTRKKVIIVEDDPLLAMELEARLSDSSFSVVGTAQSLDDAKALVASTRFDFAILDYNLGRETSAEIAERLAKDAIPFVYLTGQHPSVIAKDGAPQAAVISKTANIEEITRHICAQ